MKYILQIASREYFESIKAKGFWVSVLMFPILISVMIKAPMWLEKKATPTRYYIVVDQSGSFGPGLLSTLKTNSPGHGDGGGKYQLTELPPGVDGQSELARLAEALKPYLCHEKRIQVNGHPADLEAAILIPRDIEASIIRPTPLPNGLTNAAAARPGAGESHPIQYWSMNASDFTIRNEVERLVNTEIRRRDYLARGVDATAVRAVERTYAPFSNLSPKKEKGQEQVGATDVIRQWAPSAFTYLLWVSIFTIMQMLLSNTIEEKSNRIIEVLLSSVTPGELMLGKLFGIAAVGLTMVGCWMLSLFGLLSYATGGPGAVTTQILTVLRTSNLIPLFAIYFLFGYLMYSACILALGSICNTLKEAQSYMGGIVMIMMVPLMTMTFIPKDPNGTVARALSWVPIYTPFVMMNRATAHPPLVDLLGTFVLLLVSTVGAFWLAGKIFRIGILRTGQPPKLLELLRWAARKDDRWS
jgi:ABC-2 type transport system permease protein